MNAVPPGGRRKGDVVCLVVTEQGLWAWGRGPEDGGVGVRGPVARDMEQDMAGEAVSVAYGEDSATPSGGCWGRRFPMRQRS